MTADLNRVFGDFSLHESTVQSVAAAGSTAVADQAEWQDDRRGNDAPDRW